MINFNNLNNNKKKYHLGKIRTSQLLTTFGIGSIVDFVKKTTIIGGADNWFDDKDENRKIVNENLQDITGESFFVLPKANGDEYISEKNQDIESYIFPKLLYCPICKQIIHYKDSKDHLSQDGKKCKGHLVPSRFVVICQNGHIDDFPYSQWLHNGEKCPSGKKSPRIKMYNADNRNDIGSLILECEECNKKRSMVGIFEPNALNRIKNYHCSGKHPHLGDDYKEECELMPTGKLRTSSSIYFPINYSALLIPPWSQKALYCIEKIYKYLSGMSEDKRKDIIQEEVLNCNANLTMEDCMKAYRILEEKREKKIIRTESDIYQDEYNVLCRDNIVDERYSAHHATIPSDFGKYFESITVVDRLVVTMALTGFTRLYSPNSDKDSHIVSLFKKKPEWFPGVELNGEGVFFRFKSSAIDEWLQNIGDRYSDLKKAYNESYLKSPKFSVKYIMLHTFAHLLIRQIADECGYSAASIKERIYSDFSDKEDGEMSGVLIYLSSSDSDGSMGGLISVAEDTELLDKVLKKMLQEAMWCSADPVCALSKHQGYESLNYAACYACTLLPETSCEFSNILLDRVSIVGQVDNYKLGLMGDLTKEL